VSRLGQLALIGGLLCLAPRTGESCQGFGPESTAAAFHANDVAVRGVVDRLTRAASVWQLAYLYLRGGVAALLGTDDPYWDDWHESSRYGLVAEIRVLEDFKGAGNGVLEVNTGFGNGDCGMPFTEGQEYVVFALRLHPEDEEDPYLFTGLYYGNLPVERAESVLAELRSLKGDKSTPPSKEAVQ
jgi:hypothetical protein